MYHLITYYYGDSDIQFKAENACHVNVQGNSAKRYTLELPCFCF